MSQFKCKCCSKLKGGRAIMKENYFRSRAEHKKRIFDIVWMNQPWRISTMRALTLLFLPSYFWFLRRFITTCAWYCGKDMFAILYLRHDCIEKLVNSWNILLNVKKILLDFLFGDQYFKICWIIFFSNLLLILTNNWQTQVIYVDVQHLDLL